MDRMPANALEKFICSWNSEFPNYLLNAADLKNPHSVINTLLHVFERLGFDRESILTPLPEELHNEHTIYYWDLLPVINMTRVLNHLVSIKPNVFYMNIMHFLQPTTVTSHSILLLMFNFMLFNEDRLRDISPYEEELFAKTDQVKTLENQKNKLLEMLNQQAEEKAERAERLKKLDNDIKTFEEELKQEKELHDKEKQELEAIFKENQQLDIFIEQKKTQRDALLEEVMRKRALRVYDADDIKAKAEQAAQNVKEAEEKMNSLRTTLMLKENCLKNLQTVKPSLEIANNLLKDIARAVDSLKECESGDLESDTKEGELNLLHTDLSEAQAQLAEVQTARRETARRRHDAQAKRLAEKATIHSALREAEERDKKCKEQSKNALELIEGIKQQTVKYEEQKASGMEEISNIQKDFLKEQKHMEDFLIKKALEVEKRLSEKMRNRQI